MDINLYLQAKNISPNNKNNSQIKPPMITSSSSESISVNNSNASQYFESENEENNKNLKNSKKTKNKNKNKAKINPNQFINTSISNISNKSLSKDERESKGSFIHSESKFKSNDVLEKKILVFKKSQTPKLKKNEYQPSLLFPGGVFIVKDNQDVSLHSDKTDKVNYANSGKSYKTDDLVSRNNLFVDFDDDKRSFNKKYSSSEKSNFLDKSMFKQCVPKDLAQMMNNNGNSLNINDSFKSTKEKTTTNDNNILDSINNTNTNINLNDNDIIEKMKKQINSNTIKEYIPKAKAEVKHTLPDITNVYSNSTNKIFEQGEFIRLQTIIKQNLIPIQSLLPQLLNNFITFCTDPHGNYLVQQILLNVTHDDLRLITNCIIACFKELYYHNYATRVVQKLIELSQEDILLMLREVIANNLTLLCKDHNGIHIVYKYAFVSQDAQFIYNFIYTNIISICTDKEGCCLIQKLLENKSNQFNYLLYTLLAKKSIELINDKYANYVIQSVIMNGPKLISKEITDCLLEPTNLKNIGKQKFSCNIIEKCLDGNHDYIHIALINSLLIEKSLVKELIIDTYGTYIIQKVIPLASETERRKLFKILVHYSYQINESIVGSKVYNKIKIMYQELCDIEKKKHEKHLLNSTIQSQAYYNQPSFYSMNPQMNPSNYYPHDAQNSMLNNYIYPQQHYYPYINQINPTINPNVMSQVFVNNMYFMNPNLPIQPNQSQQTQPNYQESYSHIRK